MPQNNSLKIVDTGSTQHGSPRGGNGTSVATASCEECVQSYSIMETSQCLSVSLHWGERGGHNDWNLKEKRNRGRASEGKRSLERVLHSPACSAEGSLARAWCEETAGRQAKNHPKGKAGTTLNVHSRSEAVLFLPGKFGENKNQRQT